MKFKKVSIPFNDFMELLGGLPDHIQDSLSIHTRHYNGITDVPGNPIPEAADPYEPQPLSPITIVSFNRADSEIHFRFDHSGELVDVLMQGKQFPTETKIATYEDREKL